MTGKENEEKDSVVNELMSYVSCILFFSVDVPGSTAGKYHSHNWYDDIKFVLAKHSESVSASGRKSGGVKITKFKDIGDQVIYSVLVNSVDDVISSLTDFVDATNKVISDKSLHETFRALKVSAWLAMLPSDCRAFETNGGDVTLHTDLVRGLERNKVDVIGRAMDTGFRLSGKASGRMMMLSVELAWVVAYCLEEKATENVGVDSKGEKFALGYSGKDVLKGVLDNRSYPQFWICLRNAADARFLELESALVRGDCALFTERKQFTIIKDVCSSYVESFLPGSRPWFPLKEGEAAEYMGNPFLEPYDGEICKRALRDIRGIDLSGALDKDLEDSSDGAAATSGDVHEWVRKLEEMELLSPVTS